MKIKSAHGRHRPHHLGQHSERHHNLQVGLVAAQCLQEGLILQPFGLQHRYPLLHRILLDGRRLQRVMVSPHRLVGHRDHRHDIIVVFH